VTLASTPKARDSVLQATVLVKNEKQTLPLSAAGHKTLALIGPNSNLTNTKVGK
jgi:hypothetical protein